MTASSLWRGRTRLLVAFVFAFLASSGFAVASTISVNKQFSPGTINIGATSTVTVTLQNSSTASAATITAFSDDIGTMAGIANIAAAPALATTCAGGTPSIAGNVVTMNNGSVPIAPSSSTPGSCTISFKVIGAAAGNGFNTIFATNVVTSNGSPGGDVTQTLSVLSLDVVVTSGAAQVTQMGASGTVSFKIANPTATLPLTGVAFNVTGNSAASFTITGASTGGCGGSFGALPPAGVSGTVNFSGLTVPAGGSCTVTLTLTQPTANVVNFSLPANPTVGSISDNQNVTNSGAGATKDTFVNGKPTITKSFSPTTVAPGTTTTLTIKVQNLLSITALTSAAFTDTLPGSPQLTLAANPTANAACGAPTLTGNGTGTLGFSSGTIAANSTCIVTATVTIPATEPAGGLTNTIPATAFTSTQVSGSTAAASATLTMTGGNGGMTQTKAFAAPGSFAPNTPFKETVTFSSIGAPGGSALTAGTFTDNLPQAPTSLIGYTDATHLPSFSAGCGGSGAVTFTSSNQVVNGSGLQVPLNGTCVVTFYVEFPNSVGNTVQDTNTITALNTSFTNGTHGAINPTGGASANVKELPALSIANYLALGKNLKNQPITVTGEITDSGNITDTSVVATFNLTAGKVKLTNGAAEVFTLSPGCASSGITSADITTSSPFESFVVTAPSISTTCDISYSVIDEGGFTGTAVPANSTYKSTLTGGVAVAQTGQNSVTWASSKINVTKSFTPNQIQAGATSTADINLSVAGITGFATTELDGMAFTDTLPAGISFASVPNVSFTAACQVGTQPAPSFVLNTVAGTIAFSNISTLTTGTVTAPCDATFNVTSQTVGAPKNVIAAGSITSTSGATNASKAQASLTVTAGVAVGKTFVNGTMAIGGSDYIRFLITNSASTSALTGGTLADSMPTSLALASTTLGPIQGGDPPLCGGAIGAGTVGSSSFTLTGLSVGALVGSTPGQCVVYVQVTTTSTASAPSTAVNTIAIGALNFTSFSNQTSSTGSETLTPPPAPTITKAFSPIAIAAGASSVLTITIANTASGAAALSGMALTDTLPANVFIAAVPASSTTCTGGTVTAVAGSGSVSLASGTVAAAASCTITVSVTSSLNGSYVNTIPASALTTTQGATNASPATATLTVAPPVTISKAFSPASITSGANSVLTITIANSAAGAIALTSVGLTDTLPAGITVAAIPGASTTCTGGSIAAAAGATTVVLSGGGLSAAASCTITVSVTGTTPNSYVNTIPASALTSTQGVTNSAPATATLTVTAPPVTISKAFSPTSITSGASSVLTITVANTGSGAIALTGIGLTDALPAGITVAAVPGASTTCTGGSITAAAGATSVVLSGGGLSAAASCAITVSVTGTTPNSYVNTIPASALTSTQGVTNTAPATATLTVTAPPVAISKAFSPTSIISGASSVLTITVANTGTGAIALTNVGLTDALPAGITVAAIPGASTTCTGGSVTAAAGAASVVLSGGGLAASATCTITVSVTGTTPNSYVNTIPASALTSTQGVTNTAPATATLTVTAPPVTITKAFSPTSILSGASSVLTITVANTGSGAIALTNVGLTDSLPAGITVAAIPGASTTCTGGSVAAAAGAASVVLSSGGIAAAGSCTITVSVTGTTPNSYVNTIPASALTSTQGVTNTAPATATLTITGAPVTISKAFSPTTITSGTSSVLTITVANTGSGAIALTNVGLTDALPAGITVAAVPGASTTCTGGSVTAAAGAASVVLSGGGLAASATCTITVSVTGTTPNSYVNTIPASALTSTQGVTNTAPATATLTITGPPVTITKAFSPTSITSGASSVLTITVANTGSSAIALTNVGLTDALPAGITVAAVPGASTTCTGGSIAAAAGAASVVLSGGGLAASASCTITVSVTGATPNSYVNTIPASALTSTQGVTNTAPATATLTVTAPPVTISKAFSPTSIISGANSVLTITVANTGSGAIALTNVGLTDALPTGITVAAIPGASTTCTGGSVTAAAGATSVVLSGGGIAAAATCTIAVSVTGTTPNSYVNTIPASALTSTQGVTNTAPATATLTIAGAPVTISKAFSPTTITSGANSVLTITVANTGTGAIALTGIGLTDALPAGITVAAVPAASTTCAGGSVTAAAGATSVVLGGGGVAAAGSCTITVSVTGTTPNRYVNTIPASALTSTQGITNTAPATATLTVTAPPVTITKAFSPTSITSGASSVLTITVANTGSGAVALTNVGLTDALPTGITVAAIPGASTTCTGGSVTAAAGATSVVLGGGGIAAAATCTIAVSVTGTTSNSYVNTIPASALTSTQGVTNTNPATATLTITAPPVAIAKAFSPSTIASGAVSILTITFSNTAANSIALTGMTLIDTLPAGITLAAVPSASTTCTGGSVTAAAGGTTVALAAGTIARGATCTINVNVTGTVAGNYLNTIPIGALTTTQGATNASPATATLTIAQPSLKVVKTSNPQGANVGPGQTIAYTIVVTNGSSVAETHATIIDTLTNATLVTGSVKVNGAPASDDIVTAHATFGTVAANGSTTITYAATVTASTAGASVGNSVTVGGDQPCVGPTCTTTSPPNTVVLPHLTVVKTINGGMSLVALPGQAVTYAMTVSNTGGTIASSVVLTDPVPLGVVPEPGTVTIGGAPAPGATVNGQTVVVPIGSIQPGTQTIVAFQAQVGDNSQGALTNSVTIEALGLQSELISNKVVITSLNPTLIVRKTASATVVTVGDRVNYEIFVAGSQQIAYGQTVVTDTLPGYVVYANGTARVNGKALEPVAVGRTLTWTFATLTAPITITYSTVIANGAPPNTTLTNAVDVTAQGPSGALPSRGHVTASVQVVGSTFGSCYPITGRVYYDTHDSGRFDDGDTGIGGVTILLDDGESVVTDELGRYNFPCVRPGMHALRLDETSLPAGARPYDDRNIDSEKSTRRLVHHTFDTTIIEDVNFAIRPRPPSP